MTLAGTRREDHRPIDPGSPVRVVVVEDDPRILHEVQEVAVGRPGLMVITGAGPTLAAVEPQLADADVVLLDAGLADGSDIQANVRTLTARGLRVLAFLEGATLDLAEPALEAGACGVVMKNEPLDRLFGALASMRPGQALVSADGDTSLGGRRPIRLSRREIDVLQMVLRGFVTKQIARQLGVEDSTVKEYLKRIRKKYADQGRNATTRTDLVRRAIEDGVLTEGHA